MKIVCKIHGVFEQRAGNHLSGFKCKQCQNEKNGRKNRKTKEQFVTEAREVHGNFYDYSLVEYEGTEKDLTIVCPIHGKFEQTPYVHVSLGCGCFKCGRERTRKSHAKTQEQAIKDFRKVHGGKYDYSLVEYLNNKVKIKITCVKHGVFEQTPEKHLKGQGCPKCLTKTETELANLLWRIFRWKFSKIRPDWLRNFYTGRPLEIGLWNDTFKLGFEYQGQGHYPNKYPKYTLSCDDVVRRDRFKKRKLKSLGYILIQIPCFKWDKLNDLNKKLYIRDSVVNEIKRLEKTEKQPELTVSKINSYF